MIKERFDYNIPFYMETIKILLEAGADIHIGKNPLEIKGIDNIPGLRAVLEEAAAKGPAEGASQRRRRATRKATRKSRKATRKSRRR
jgi:hypothetical protein